MEGGERERVTVAPLISIFRNYNSPSDRLQYADEARRHLDDIRARTQRQSQPREQPEEDYGSGAYGGGASGGYGSSFGGGGSSMVQRRRGGN